MGYSQKMFEVVADLILDAEEQPKGTCLRGFQDFVAALSIDSGLPKDEVQSILVEKMLQDSRPYAFDRNVIWLEKIVNL